MDSKISTDKYADYFLDVNQTINKDGYNCYLCNATYEKDLQLAAELGKTLLERNKELETALKNHQNIIEDQSQEIEYLTKQTAALKEVNSSRIKIYEQLEISIQDLEHANVTLSQQTAADKKQIKSLLETIQSLENKCDGLQHSLDKTNVELENEKRHRLSKSSETEVNNKESPKPSVDLSDIKSFECANCSEVVTQLQEAKATNVKEQRIIDDLRDQLSVVIQDNTYLRGQVDSLQRKEDEMKSVQEELATLEQIRSGNLCKRCLRSTVPTEDCSSADELSVLMTNEEEEDIVLTLPKVDLCDDKTDNAENPYRMLVEKYEALCKMEEQQCRRVRQKLESNGVVPTKPKNCMSLQDELRMTGGYYDKKQRYHAIETESEAEEENIPKTDSKKSETDNVFDKSTQTELLLGSLPGSFLCRISDGNDCQFSIYDDASPVESRFRKTPEYRHLFREIFAVLKRAAEAKDEGEALPLLDDRLPPIHDFADNCQSLKVPPVTPAKEEQPFIPVTNNVIDEIKAKIEEKCVSGDNIASDNEKSVEAKTVSKRNRKIDAVHNRASPSPSPCNRSASKRRAGSRARRNRRRERLTDSPSVSRERHLQKSNKPVDTGADMSQSIPNVAQRPAGLHKERPVSMFGFCGGSSASKEVAKLKILEKSYAEVLRMGRKKSTSVSKISMS